MRSKCEFEFVNNPSKVFYSGQTMDGKIKLHLKERKIVHGVYIEFSGVARAEWRKKNGRGNHMAEECYFKDQIYFIGERNSIISLMPKTYEHTFRYKIPRWTPTSITGKYGYIQYKIYVVLDMQWQQNMEFEESFIVYQPVNLNDYPILKRPLMTQKELYYSSCLSCLRTDPLCIYAGIGVGGFTPGQKINLKFDVDNKSNLNVSTFTIQLVKLISARDESCISNQKEEKIVIAEEVKAGCDFKSEKTYHVDIVVPATEPTNSLCKFVEIGYYVRILGSILGSHKNPKLDLPIIIGTSPFADKET